MAGTLGLEKNLNYLLLKKKKKSKAGKELRLRSA